MNAVKRQQDEAGSPNSQPKKPRLPEDEIKAENESKPEGLVDEDEAGSPNSQPKKPQLPEDEIKAENESKPEGLVDEDDNKKDQKIRRRKVALLLCYSGWGYFGMQRNPDTKTIEGDLLTALKKAGLISDEYYEKPQLMLFQRAARTDKGVSAVRQIVSLKIPEGADIETINEHLPAQIRVVCMKRTTKGFNSKVNCDARTYSYVLPTYAFSPAGEVPNDSYRISEETVERLNQVLKNYVGTHNFHNFTFKKGFKDPSAKRFMHRFTCGEPFIRGDKEYIILTVKGQSFMQHHIRKMIGLAIAVLRGYTEEGTILKAFKSDPLDIPKAPGLGLMLEEVHYEGYNKRYGSDGVHEKLDWSQQEKFLNDFKEKFILQNILKTEDEEQSMLNWMVTLPGHSYSKREERPPTINHKQPSSVKEECNELNEAQPIDHKLESDVKEEPINIKEECNKPNEANVQLPLVIDSKENVNGIIPCQEN